MELKYIFYVLLILSLTSCSKEAELEPSNAKENYFAADPNATDEESVLKRSFYASEKSYLLFNDTLSNVALGKDANGVMQYNTNLLDITYDVTGVDANLRYSYDYLSTTTSKKRAVEIVNNYLMGHLSGNLRPYAILLVSKIRKYNKSTYTYTYASEERYVSGKWGIVLSVDGFDTMTETQIVTAVKNTLVAIVSSRVVAMSDAVLKGFYDPVGGVFDAATPLKTTTVAANLEQLKKLGYITSNKIYVVITILNKYPTKADDMSSFLDLLLNSTEAQVNANYGAYPIVMQRYNALQKLIVDIGYVF